MYKHCDFWEIGEFYDDTVLGGVAKNASEAVAVGRVCRLLLSSGTGDVPPPSSPAGTFP